MKIAVIVASFPRLSEKFVADQAADLLEENHEVTIFALERSDERKVHAVIDRYRLRARTVYGVPSSRLERFAGALRIALRFAAVRPLALLKCLGDRRYSLYDRVSHLFVLDHFLSRHYDVVQVHFGDVGREMVFLKDFIAAKFCVVFHGYDISSYLRRNEAGVYTDLFARADLVITVSEFFRQRLLALGCAAGKIRVHYCGVNTDEYAYRERTVRSGKSVRVLSVGRLVEKKGFTYAIAAIKTVHEQYPDIAYTIIGEGRLHAALERQVRESGLDGVVRLPGAMTQDEIKKHYYGSDVLILPSITPESGDQEGIPVVLKEALATGMPVIATSHAGIPELFALGPAGFMVPEKDSEAIAESLRALIEQPAMYHSFSRSGRELVETAFNARSLIKKVVADLTAPAGYQ